jgi:ubiquinone/menaquinone biosynthesis C-methylase UbiE
LQDTLQTHIGQILEEEAIKKTIKKIGRIDDGVSKKVRQQYEENPYPRWRSANFIIMPGHKAIDQKYRIKSRVLIAGCGTGQHVLHSYLRDPHCEITAMDLSTASLAYAMKKTREYGIKNVRFVQGDILQLGTWGEQFDLVESAGVIHHMKDPEAGLRALLTVMKEDGELSLGLYSEIARRHVVKARALIEQRGFETTPEGIRACREYIKANRAEFSTLVESKDFYSTSAARDLIFHVQETRYTLPQIQEMLDRNNLEFQGFTIANVHKDDYLKDYPDDPEALNLSNWAAFEEKKPNTFFGMYQFRARRKPRA